MNGAVLCFIICCYLTNVKKKAILLPLCNRIIACIACIIGMFNFTIMILYLLGAVVFFLFSTEINNAI